MLNYDENQVERLLTHSVGPPSLPAAARAVGHIPGAVNMDWTFAIDVERNSRLRSEVELQEMLEEAGVARQKRSSLIVRFTFVPRTPISFSKLWGIRESGAIPALGPSGPTRPICPPRAEAERGDRAR